MSEDMFTEDTFTEVTNESWLGRIGGAFTGIMIGVVLFIAAVPVLFLNEGRAVRRYQTLNEGAGSVISLPEARVSAEYDGKLVHVSGKAITDEIVADPEFGVAVNAIKLKRKAEMYQWKENKKRETRKKLGGGKKTVTTYSYTKSWASNLINSSAFKKPGGHQNPDSMPYQSKEFVAAEVFLGEFKLPRSLVDKINISSILPVADLADIDDFPNADFQGSGIYFGDDPSAPQIGDLRITYQIVAPTEVSIVSRQIGQSLEPYRAQAGGTIHILNLGMVGAENMFQQAHRSNVMWTWIFRLGGFILMLVGVAMILRPLAVIADVVPLLGSIVGAGSGILSFLIAAPFAFLTVAVAWLRYRPVIGISLVILASVAAGLIFILTKRGKSTGMASPAGADSAKTKDYNGSTSKDMDQASPAVSTAPDSAVIAAAGIERIPQTATVEPGPMNAANLLKKGQNYFRTGQYDQAVIQFSRAIKSGGNQKVALYNRGVALFKLNKKEAALKDFKTAAKLGHAKATAILNQLTP
jgi:hypothetical protein